MSSLLYKGKIRACFENDQFSRDVVEFIAPPELRDFFKANKFFVAAGRLVFSGNNFFPFKGTDEKDRNYHIDLCKKLDTPNLYKIDFVFGEAEAYVEAEMIKSGRDTVPLAVTSAATDTKSADLVIRLPSSLVCIDPCRLEKEKESSAICLFSSLGNGVVRVYYRAAPYIGPGGIECSPCRDD